MTVLFFGAAADIVGTRQLDIKTPEGDAGCLLDQLIASYPRLRSHKLLISINQEYATRDSVIDTGDEVAIFTAVSGG